MGVCDRLRARWSDRRDRPTSPGLVVLHEAGSPAVRGSEVGRGVLGRRRARAVVRESSAELLSDCEAFVTGHYAEHLMAQPGRPVPAWVWTNLLAHGSLDALRADAAAGPRDRRPPLGWRAARSYLACEVLARCSDASSLADLQAGILRPLELELSSRPADESWDNRRWASEVLASLRRVPQHRHDSSDAVQG